MRSTNRAPARAGRAADLVRELRRLPRPPARR